MMSDIRKIYYFIRRDAFSFATYKLSFIMSLITTIFGVFSFGFFGSNADMMAVLKLYNMSLLSYLIAGMAFSSFLTQSLTMVQKALNPLSLEETLVTPTRLIVFVIGSSAWGFIWSTIMAFIYIAVGSTFFGVSYNANIPGVILVLILGVLAMLGLSMMASGITIVTKQGDPITWFISMTSNLFGNVLFPPQVMPVYLQAIAYINPFYYFFSALRFALNGNPINVFVSEILVLALMSAILWPLGYYVFNSGYKKAKKDGTLSWF